ncbi:MAG: chemotaxis response regulator protein-glutamate methylesterase [Alphaproteobacteria bacterium CG11_big_fil_rev_8_21_14_0_20_39_49]|nr:MAG: chemotaxis response regulator protein-glutamate methylesterase [Alphaproteobacteria bacterium CG11_big_fil_rev_8_21_14_0_20_39_49]
MPIKVLIVDDSRLIRSIFEEMLSSDSEINVVGTAVDAYDARQKIKSLNPDVVTLDVEMPKMDGIAFLEKIMTLRPMPVIMASTLTQRGADTTIKALEIGAVDYVAKPTDNNSRDNLIFLKEELINKVKIAARANVRTFNKKTDDNVKVLELSANKELSKKIIAIGSSTGGVEALREILVKLPSNMPPIVVVQHMPEKFTKQFALRLNGLCKLKVQEAVDGQTVSSGNVYIAHGGCHLKIKKKGIDILCDLGGHDKVSGHCPSVDVLFDSVVAAIGNKTLGVILTGMGKDGANGMLKIKNAGGYTIGQDESSCVVYGMPKEARQIGAINKEVSITKMSEEIIKQCM